MANFKNTYLRGINQDASKESYPQGAYYNLENGRLITDEGLAFGHVATLKGNTPVDIVDVAATFYTLPTSDILLTNLEDFLTPEALLDISNGLYTLADVTAHINNLHAWNTPRIIGSCTINDDLVLFARLIDSFQDSDQIGIFRLTPNTTKVLNDSCTVSIKNTIYHLQLICVVQNTDTVYPAQSSTEQVKIDAVGYYESERIQNIYWLDGYNSLRKLNITEPSVIFKDTALVDVITEVKLDPPRFVDINANGNLLAGQVQYALRYYIPNGQITYYSLPTPLIHLTDSNEKAADAGRQYKGTGSFELDVEDDAIITTTTLKNSNKAVTIQLTSIDSRYEYLEIVRIHYTTLNATPSITSIYTGKIPPSGLFTDTGNTNLNTYTLSEFLLYNIDFIPKTLAIKDNILFVGNIVEKFYNSDNVQDFDSRAFRYNSSAVAIIYESTTITSATHDPLYLISGTNYSSVSYYESNVFIESADLVDIQDIHAINRFNDYTATPNQDATSITYDYRYQADGTTLGGQGPNVSYTFTSKALNILQKTYDFDSSTDLHEGDQFVIDSKNNLDDLNIAPDSYASPYNSAYYKQYKRNEIYRFAIIFFSKKGIPSKPKWIGDIRTPTTLITGEYDIVTYTALETTATTKEVLVSANALGINFKVTLPSDLQQEITGFSIVRCERGQDRINLGQGLLTTARNVASGEEGIDEGGVCQTLDKDPATINLLPFVQGVVDAELESIIGVNTGNNKYEYTSYDNYEWISPEAAFNTNLSYFANSFMQPIGCTQTEMEDPNYLTCGGSFMYKLYESGGATYWTSYLDYSTATSEEECRFTYYYNISTNTWVKTQYDSVAFNMFHTFVSRKKHYVDGANDIANTIPQFKANILNAKRMSAGSTAYITKAGTTETVAWTSSMGGGAMQTCGPSMYMQLATSPLGGAGNQSYYGNTYWVVGDYIRPNIPYGGNTFTARELNTYQYIDNYVAIENYNSSSNITVFGGDTFIGFYQHVRGTIGATQYTDNNLSDINTSIVTFPCESTINLNLRHDTYLPTYTGNFNIHQFAEVRPDDGCSCKSPVKNIPSLAQLEDLYLYNTVFSKSDGVRIFQSYLDNANKSNNFPNKILASKRKYLGEYIDSWTQFGVNEFIEVDSTLGEVTKLLAYKDSLHCFQPKGISKLAVNEKSTIQDDSGQSIVLGTGGVLPYATYITKTSGSSHKWSVIGTPEIIMYYDLYNNTISYVTDANGSISDVKGLFKLFSEFPLFKLNDVFSTYLPKYREIEFNFDFTKSNLTNTETDSSSTTIVFNEKLKTFTQTYDRLDSGTNTIIPFMSYPSSKFIFETRRLNGVVPIGKLYVRDESNLNYNTFFQTTVPLKLTLVVNPRGYSVVTYDNLEYISKVINPTGLDTFSNELNLETITSIRVYNSTQDTGIIDLTASRARNYIRRIMRIWRYNYLRDSKSTTVVNRLKDNYFMVELTFDSTKFSSTTPRYFELGSINSTFRDPMTTSL
jgi:hypothetical protein